MQFVELDLPSGWARFHSGVGSITVDGRDWVGVTDPIMGMVAAVETVREPRIGEAAGAQLVLQGANVEFLRSVHATKREIEGRTANLYFAVFDAETATIIGRLIPQILNGYMSSPTILEQGIGVRTVSLTIETMWSSKNFAPGNKWNGAGQRKLFPNDKGLDFVGQKIVEQVK